MDKLFLRGLSTCNTRCWGPTQHERWKQLLSNGSIKHIGIENEVLTTSSYDSKLGISEQMHFCKLRDKVREECKSVNNDTTVKVFSNTWIWDDDSVNRKQIEIVAFMNAYPIHDLVATLNKLIQQARDWGLVMDKSMHFNIVVGEKEASRLSSLREECFANFSQDSDFFVEDENGQYSYYDAYWSNNQNFKKLRRLQSRAGIASMNAHDYIQQFFVLLSLRKIFLKIDNKFKQGVNRIRKKYDVKNLRYIRNDEVLYECLELLCSTFMHWSELYKELYDQETFLISCRPIHVQMTSMHCMNTYYRKDDGYFLASGNVSVHSVLYPDKMRSPERESLSGSLCTKHYTIEMFQTLLKKTFTSYYYYMDLERLEYLNDYNERSITIFEKYFKEHFQKAGLSWIPEFKAGKDSDATSNSNSEPDSGYDFIPMAC